MAGYDDRCRAKGVGMGTPRGPQRQAAARARAVIGGQLLTVSIESGRLDCGVVHMRPMRCLARSRGFINCNDMITRHNGLWSKTMQLLEGCLSGRHSNCHDVRYAN